MIADIRAKISSGAFEFSKHAVDQTVVRQITVSEIREAIAAGEIIEDYPDDKYGPSCLVFGHTSAGRANSCAVQPSFERTHQNHHCL